MKFFDKIKLKSYEWTEMIGKECVSYSFRVVDTYNIYLPTINFDIR